MKLGDVASVRSGLVLSRKESKKPTEYRYPVLNLRSIVPKGYIDTEKLDSFFVKQSLPDEYLTRAGDIIVRLTAPYTAVLIDQCSEGIVISSNFAVIRTDQNLMLPEYLHWLLNSSQVKHEIYENATSNMLGAVKTGFFADYKLPDISLDQQKTIADLNHLAQRELQLLRKLEEQKEALYLFTISQLHKQMGKGKKR